MARRPRLIWTAPALDDLDHIASWIAVENERAGPTWFAESWTPWNDWRAFRHSAAGYPKLPPPLPRGDRPLTAAPLSSVSSLPSASSSR